MPSVKSSRDTRVSAILSNDERNNAPTKARLSTSCAVLRKKKKNKNGKKNRKKRGVPMHITLSDCEKRCDASSDGFICRAYTIEFAAESTNLPTCYLHSEDTIGAGISVLAHTARAFYKEREPCIDAFFGHRCYRLQLKNLKKFKQLLDLHGLEPFQEDCDQDTVYEFVSQLIQQHQFCFATIGDRQLQRQYRSSKEVVLFVQCGSAT
ncbi:unnamed protein product, partial [Trichogramma brassicae]